MKVPAGRYAAALFLAAGDIAANEATLAQLQVVAGALDATPQVKQLLAYPTVRPDVAAQVLDVVTRYCSPLVSRFVRVVAVKGRILYLDAIVEAYRAQVEAARGVRRARVQSARALTVEQLARLVRVLSAMFSGAIVATTEAHPELLGGVRVVIGDRVLDGSLVGELVDLRRRLMPARA